MKKFILTLTALLFSCAYTWAYEQVTGGPWNTIFGETVSQIEKKIKTAYPNAELKIFANEQISILSDVQVAGEVFSGGTFLFRDNKFAMCMFNKSVQYENAFSNHLNYKQAEQWLVANRYKVDQIVNPLKNLISGKYGTPFKNAENDIMWRDNKGNIIQIIIERDTNIAADNIEFTNMYGCLPSYSIVLIYVEPNDIPDF